MSKKFFIKTYGCQMNTYDSDTLCNAAIKLDYALTDNEKEADLIILNTCHIREKATEKLYSALGKLKRIKINRLKEENKNTIIAVTGCIAQAEGDIIKHRINAVDIIAGPETYHKFPEMLVNAEKQMAQELIELDFQPHKKFDYIDGELKTHNRQLGQPSAFITIQEGCDRFCTFCVVPYTRGPEFSRKVESILDEAKQLADHGTKEVHLLGQNVNAYHGICSKGSTYNLAQLICRIAEIKGIERIRYTTSHPAYMSTEIIAIHGAEKKLMPALSLPVQSGSNAILKAMNRQHSREEYMEVVRKLRLMRPDISMSSDFIIDFPGEKEEDFEDTLDLIRQINFTAQSYSFNYSSRPGTPAAKKDFLTDEERKERLQKVQNLLEDQRNKFNESFINKTVSVLFDSKKTRQGDQLKGRTEYNQITIINNLTPELRNKYYGQIVKVNIKENLANSLIGTIEE